MYTSLHMLSISISYGIFNMSQIWIKIWPWSLGHRRTPVGGQYVPLETVTNSSYCFFISCKLTTIYHSMDFFGLLPILTVNVNFLAHLPWSHLGADLRTLNILILCLELPEIWPIEISWPLHFGLIFSVKVTDTILTFLYFHPHTKNLLPSTSSWFCYTRTYTRAHHPITVRGVKIVRQP